MIDWKTRCLEIATLMDKYSRDKMSEYKAEAIEKSKRVLADHKLDQKANKKFMEYWREPDKKKARIIYQEYLDLIRSIKND